MLHNEFIILNNGVKMPMIGIGTYQRVVDEDLCEQSIVDAIQAGYRLIDTAWYYMNEEAVGRAIKRCGVDRSELFVTTKVWFTQFEEEDCRRSLEDSFAKLDLEYIDMVLIHWPYGNVYSAWRVLEEYYEAGKVRAIGVSNMTPDRLVDLINYNKIKPSINQIETHIYCQRVEDRTWNDKMGVATQAYSPLGQGLASEMTSEPIVIEIAQKYSRTPVQILLRFLVQNNIAIIPKSTHLERIKENADIFDFSLEEEDIKLLRGLDRGKPRGGDSNDPARIFTCKNW
ncbi:MAG TPA: aldo/keto reductase [Saccharofermentans sp.]|nr:aldo/keto reductase [Saccharofermentans sp.]HPE27533.1 aldo/keto reductase [Saccharofermentans sp.]HPJ81191.1 aldo/keto reductase [Saccharofermentans sp.]HPQ31459.1 aldo/keto reductase [Saccharofermentans sp.]HRV50531.1 aldo/keto reductase [Saccharofermentans sp.]